jgi:hypothetical protein
MRDVRRRREPLEIVLVIATLLGGFAAIWYFWDRLSGLWTRQAPDASTAPDLRVSGVRVTDKMYEVTVTNHGSVTAEPVELIWNYSYATQIVTRARELPPRTSITFQSQMFPLEDLLAMRGVYEDAKNRLADGTRALIVKLTIRHVWRNSPLERHYTIVWDGETGSLV